MSHSVKERPFHLHGVLRPTPVAPINHTIERALARLLDLRRLDRLYLDLPASTDSSHFAQQVLELFNIGYRVPDTELQRIPRSGGAVLVANHPFGAIEGVIMAHLLQKVRPDVRILANRFLTRIPELRELFLAVDVFGGAQAAQQNATALREAVRWVKSGGLLLTFPAGEVAHWRTTEKAITDPPWQPMMGRLIRMTGAPVVPVHIGGANSLLFQLLGLVHPRLRTALLPREMTNKAHRTIALRVGKPVAPQRLARFADDTQRINFLRLRTYALQDAASDATPALAPETDKLAPLADAIDPTRLEHEIARLPANQHLVSSGEFDVYCGYAEQIPLLMQEIGRLRELTFRDTGEGTGKASDIDLFDSYYLHLFLWNREKRELAGAYRLGQVDEILKLFGRKGLYTQTLFRYGQGLLNRLGPALELGRSFVRREYQRSFSPLMLLWRGIGEYIARHPRYRVLFGPVSISREYQTVSQQLMVEFLRANRFAADLAPLVKPRRPFRARRSATWRELKGNPVNGIEPVSELIADIEPDSKGVPILIKHYLKMGGRVLGFNVDPDFSDVLDGLIMVDLTETDSKMLARYMGAEGAEGFLAHHAADQAAGKDAA